MSEDEPEPEPDKPRYLLPDGCKDLADVLRLQKEFGRDRGLKTDFPPPGGFPASVSLPEFVRIGDLAQALRLQPYQLMMLLMQRNVFATINTYIDIQAASALCEALGVTVHRLR